MVWRIGIDEAGRGPLAGPVAVGVFAVPDSFDYAELEGIRDSKVLNEQQREAWYQKLTVLPLARHAVRMVGAPHIDKYGITSAIRIALTDALNVLELDATQCEVLLDGGLHAPKEYIHQHTIIRGDATERCISSAAILAKVTRDYYMIKQDALYPMYGFAGHKGYGTRQHRDALREYGLCRLHRKSFCHIKKAEH